MVCECPADYQVVEKVSHNTIKYVDKFKYIYLDMDGTIADLYNIDHWLDRIRCEEEGIFLKATPIITEDKLMRWIKDYKDRVWVVTMAPPLCSLDYKIQVFKEKDMWLNKHFPHIMNRMFCNYQSNKNIFGKLGHKSEEVLLIDDDQELRDTFLGSSITPFWMKMV